MTRRDHPGGPGDQAPDLLSRCGGKRILITGGAGMIGSTVARLAVRHGARVTILDSFLPMYGGNLFNLEGIRSSVQLVYGDIRDGEAIRQVVPDQDLIFNMAAQVSYVDSNRDPFFDLDVNCRGHLNVLEACRRHNPDARLIFPSSRFVYGEIEYNPVDEKHPYNCLSIYGVHKLNGEKYYQFYHRAHGISTQIFRIANPYGPRQQMKHSKYGIVNWFIRLALEGRPLTIYGDGLQKRDYVFVEDLAEAMLAAALKEDLRHGVFNLGSGVGTAFRDMVRMVASEVEGTRVVQTEWPKERAFVETGDYVSDIGRVRKALAWRPRTDLREGIRKTVAFYRENRKHYW